MELTISKAAASRALSLVQSSIERRTTMPILSNLLLSSSGGELRISATDLEITTVIKIPARVKSDGRTTVNARVFGDIIKELLDGDIHLSLNQGERLKIQSQRSEMTIVGVSADEYPSLPGLSIETTAKISSSLLSEMISRTLYAVSTDEARFNLNGVCFEGIPEKRGGTNNLRLVATDGHRLSMVTRPVGQFRVAERVIAPRKGLLEVRRLLESDISGESGIDIRDGFLVVETLDAKIAVRLIDGEFPDYTQVLPKDSGTVVEIPQREFAQAIKRGAILVSDKAKGLELHLSKDNICVRSSSPELGESKEDLAVQYGGDSFRVGFNARYLLDITSVIEEGSLCMEFHGELGPGKIWPKDDDSSLAIVMPMRLA